MVLTGGFGTKKEIINLIKIKNKVVIMKYLNYGKAICYSGYRKNQSPITQIYPTYENILEDLKILENDFDYIRMYDANDHTKMTLETIRKNDLKLKVLVGMDLLGEANNHDCAWGGDYSVEEIAKNIEYNQSQLHKAIELVNEFEDIVLGVSAGNEAVPEWNENLVSPGRVLYFVQELKKYTNVPVTYCDNNYYWRNQLKEVAEAVDFISIHIYPVWLGANVSEGISTSIREFNEIKNLYPNKQVIITETGWPTNSNGGQISKENANEMNQLFFNNELDKYTKEKKITCFFFEAFDEFWKGSDAVDEPEKNWGYYYDDRTPKRIKLK